MKSVLKLDGLDCPVCAGKLEEIVGKIDGVSFASLSFANQALKIEYAGATVLQKVIETVNAFEEVKVVETRQKKETGLKIWLPVLLAALFLGAGVLAYAALPNAATESVRYICCAVAYLLAGYKVLLSTCKNVLKGRIFDENFLMTVASVGAILLGEYLEGVLVLLLYQTGETLQAAAVGASRKSVAQLMDLKTETAHRCLPNGETEDVLPENLAKGDCVLVKAGEKIPCDGVLLTETATVDEKALTGESEPRFVQTGGELLSGTLNAGNAFQMTVERVAQESAAQKILDLLENSVSEKAESEKFITKFAKVYTPVVCALALFVAFAVPLLAGLLVDGAFYLKDFSRWAKAALTFLVVSCPCALVISVPLTYFSGIGACARRGVLVKGATHLDVAAQVKTVAFDKTGTLTEGNFAVCAVHSETDVSAETVLAVAAALERFSTHPIGKAFAEQETPYLAENVSETAGQGLRGEIGGKRVSVGNAALLRADGVPFTECESPYGVLYVAENGRFLGAVEIQDKLREHAKETVSALRKAGYKTVMLSGDNARRAESVAVATGVDEWQAGLFPQDKLQSAKALQEQGKLLYVGDGINDAPVMLQADCSASMGKLGSAAAVETSDFVLIADELSGIETLLQTSKKTARTVRQNVVFSIAMKAAFMALGLFGLPLSLAVFADVGVMLLAVLNALRIK